MKNNVKIAFAILVLALVNVVNINAQRNSDYTYQNQGNYDRNSDNYDRNRDSYRDYNYPNSRERDAYYQRAYGYNNAATCQQNRRYYAASAELQRLYQMEDALLMRYEADLRLGDRRAVRKDLDKLDDIQRLILREERRYAYANPNYRRDYDDRYYNRYGRRH